MRRKSPERSPILKGSGEAGLSVVQELVLVIVMVLRREVLRVTSGVLATTALLVQVQVQD